MDKHFGGHQQALIKDGLVVAVLVFLDHDEQVFQETFNKFDYDKVVDLCKVQQEAPLGGSWDGQNFYRKPFPSWTLTDQLQWEAPIPYPDDNKEYIWNEAEQEWTYTGYYFEDGELKKEEITEE